LLYFPAFLWQNIFTEKIVIMDKTYLMVPLRKVILLVI